MWQSPIPRLTRKANCHTVTRCQYTICPLSIAMHRHAPPARRHHQSRRRPPIDVRPLTVVPEDTWTHGRSPPVAARPWQHSVPAARHPQPFAVRPFACSSARLGPVSAVPPCLSRPPTPTAARQNPGVVLECRRLFVDSFKTWTLDNDEKMRSPCVLGGVIFSISEAEVRTDTHNTHADAHTHGTCTSKGQQAADHSHPAAHNTEKQILHQTLPHTPVACRRMHTYPRPGLAPNAPRRPFLSLWSNGLCACVERTSHRPSDETYGRLHWGGWSGEKK